MDLDSVDFHLLALLQDDCRTSLTRLGEIVGLSAPAVLERVKKLEAGGVIGGYHAVLDARRLGLDVTAFIGVITSVPDRIENTEQEIGEFEDVLEVHHVTGEYSLLLKAKTENTSSLEQLISRLRSLDGVARTETLVVLSTHTERTQIALHPAPAEGNGRRSRRPAERNGRQRRA
jgi:Lrp/AsnC family leucine-responsive transcriptional regulator